MPTRKMACVSATIKRIADGDSACDSAWVPFTGSLGDIKPFYLGTFKSIFIDDSGHRFAPIFGSTTNDPAFTPTQNIRRCTNDVRGDRYGELDVRANRHLSINVEQDAA